MVASTVTSELFKRSIYAGYIVSFVYSGNIDTIPSCGAEILKWTVRGGLHGFLSFPPMLLPSFAAHLASGIISLDLHNLFIDDRFMEALARSGAAETLQKLVMIPNRITDASAASFTSFTQLKMLKFYEELPNNCKGPWMLMLQSIAQLPNLEVLELPETGLGLCFVLDTVLATSALPYLREFTCFDRDEDDLVTMRYFRELIELRPHPELIENIQIHLWDRGEDAEKEYLALHAIMPNWNGDVGAMENVSALFDAISHKLTRLSTYIFDFRPAAPEDFAIAARKVPRAQNLDIKMDPVFRGPVSFAEFKHLKQLSLKMSHFTQITWPEKLLSLTVDLLSSEDATALDRLVESLCTPALGKSLEELSLTLYKGSMEETHLRKLLCALSNLQDIEVALPRGSSSLSTPHSKVLRLSHPKLTQMPLLTYFDFSLVPSWTPSILDLNCDSVQLKDTRQWSLGSLQSLSITEVPTHSGPLPQHLILQPHATINIRTLKALTKLRNIISLDLRTALLLTELATVVESLPLLTYCKTFVACHDSHQISLQHRRLNDLSILQRTEDAPATPFELTVNFSSDKLPALRCLSLDFPFATIPQILMTNFHELEVVDVSAARGPVGLELRECERLLSFKLVNANFKSINMSSLPALHEVELRKCLLMEEFTISDFSASLPSGVKVTAFNEDKSGRAFFGDIKDRGKFEEVVFRLSLWYPGELPVLEDSQSEQRFRL
jgi:hypothetical protein